MIFKYAYGQPPNQTKKLSNDKTAKGKAHYGTDDQKKQQKL